jgi:hypothetical protein
MPLGSVRVARTLWVVGSPDGPAHNVINATGSRARTQISVLTPANGP